MTSSREGLTPIPIPRITEGLPLGFGGVPGDVAPQIDEATRKRLSNLDRRRFAQDAVAALKGRASEQAGRTLVTLTANKHFVKNGAIEGYLAGHGHFSSRPRLGNERLRLALTRPSPEAHAEPPDLISLSLGFSGLQPGGIYVLSMEFDHVRIPSGVADVSQLRWLFKRRNEEDRRIRGAGNRVNFTFATPQTPISQYFIHIAPDVPNAMWWTFTEASLLEAGTLRLR